jgi:hypothetical protein
MGDFQFSTISAFLREEATGVISYDDSFPMLTQIKKQLLQGAVVQDVIADDTVLEALENDAEGRTELPGAAVISPCLKIVPEAGHASRSIQQDLRRILAPKVHQFSAPLEEVPGDRHLIAR